MHWRHERLSVAMAQAGALHHSAQPRGQTGEARAVRRATAPDDSPARPLRGMGVSTETLVLDVPVLQMIEEDPLDHDLFHGRSRTAGRGGRRG